MPEEKEREKKFAQDFLDKWLRAEQDEGPAEDVLQKIDAALKADANDAASWFRRGTVLLDLERWEGALESFRRVEALDAAFPRIHLALAFSLTKLGRTEEAAEAQKKALEVAAPEVGEPQPESPKAADEALAGLAEDLLADEAEEAVKDLEALETLAEGPGIADEEDFAAALLRWESEGYDVAPLRAVMEKDPDRVRTAFFQFEQNVRKVKVLEDTVRAIIPEGLEKDIERMRALFRAPYQIWRIEAEMATLMEKSDARDRARRPQVAPPPPPSRPRARPPGATNGRPAPGRVNGLAAGRVNGLVPPGRVNGLINGITRARAGFTNGLTNGLGVTNGLAGRRFAAEARTRRGRLLLIPSVAALLLSLVLLAPLEPEPVRGGRVIDGLFEDWEGTRGYTQPSVGGNPDVDLRGYMAFFQDDLLSVYANVTGRAFGDTQGLDVWYVFLDADGDRTNGYDEGRIGADVLLELQGGNGNVTQAQALEFVGADREDWSAWRGLPAPITAAANGSELELQLDVAALDAFDEKSASFSLVLEDQVGWRSASNVAVGPVYGALEVRQSPAGRNVTAGSDQEFLVLTFRSIGSFVNVTAIDVAPGTGTPLPIGFAPLSLAVNESRNVTLTVDATGLAAETLLSASLRSVTADRPVTILGTGARAYVAAAPPGKRVDGLFGEWNATAGDADPEFIRNAHVDIVNYTAEVDNTTAYAYVKFRGSALGGGHESHLRARPTEGPQGAPGPAGLPERRPGENIVRIFYDRNSTGAGLPIAGIVADAYAEVRGRHGQVRQKSAFLWQDGWVPQGTTDAESVGAELEMSVEFPGLDLRGADYVIDARDWRQEADRTDVGGVRGVRSGPDGFTFTGAYDATLPSAADGWVRFARGEEQVAWRLPRVSAVGETGTRTIATPEPAPFTPNGFGGTFRGAYPALDLDVEYRAEFGQLKETLTLASPPEFSAGEDVEFEMPLHRQGDLLVEVTGLEDGKDIVVEGPLSFVDGRGLSLTLLPPWIEDARGVRLDLAFRWRMDRLAIRVPGAWLLIAEYPVTVDPTTTYTLRNQGPSADDGEQLGWSVAVGDFNGDGYADVLTGAPSNNLGGNNHGYAYVFFGPFTVDDTTPDVRMNGTEPSASLGYSVAAGKFNGDAYWDALVARRSVDSIAGPVSLFYGSSSWSGLDNTPDVNFTAPSSPKSFGWAVASGNLDNANFDDVLIGEPGKDNNADSLADGIVHVYLSPFSAVETSADFTLFPSTNASGQLGRALAVGNIDSDAYADVVAGEPLHSSNQGRVQFYKGISFASGSGNRYPNATLGGQSAAEQFGSSLSVGKLNGDAYDDLTVGAPFKTTDAGAAYLYNANSDGTGLTTGASPAITLASQSANERFGVSVLIADFDGDGTNGVLVGATHANAGGTRRGSVYWFDDPLTDQTPDETMSGTQTDERFGQSLGRNKFASDPWTVVAIGAHLWDDAANDNDGRAVVAQVPEPATAFLAVVIPLALGARLFHRRRLVRQR